MSGVAELQLLDLSQRVARRVCEAPQAGSIRHPQCPQRKTNHPHLTCPCRLTHCCGACVASLGVTMPMHLHQNARLSHLQHRTPAEHVTHSGIHFVMLVLDCRHQ